MSDQPIDPLAKPLRREADGLAEPFSDELHGRLMRRVREERILAAVPATPRWQLLIAGTCAAAVLALVIMLRQQQSPPSTPKQVKTDADLAMVTQWIREAAHPVQESVNVAMQPEGMAYLDQDIQTFGHFVVSQFNSLPEAQPKNRPTEIR